MDDRRWVVDGSEEPMGLGQLYDAHLAGELEGKTVRRQGSEVALTDENLAALFEEAKGTPIAPPPQADSPYPRGAEPTPATEDPMRFVVPMNPSGIAVIAGYVGLISLCLPIGVIALVLGLFALRDLNKNPTKTGKGRAIFAIVVGSINTGLVLYAVFNAVMTSPS